MAVIRLSFPPPPIGVSPAPIGVPLLVLADQDAEANAGAPVALFAQLVKSDHFSLGVALSLRPRRDQGHGNQHRGNAGCREHHIPFHFNLHFRPARCWNYFGADELTLNSRPGRQRVFKRSMSSDLIRGWIPVRVKTTRQDKNMARLRNVLWMLWRTWREQHDLDHHHDHHHHDEIHAFDTALGRLTLEVFEDGVPPRWRLRVEAGKQPNADSISLQIQREGGAREVFAFAAVVSSASHAGVGLTSFSSTDLSYPVRMRTPVAMRTSPRAVLPAFPVVSIRPRQRNSTSRDTSLRTSSGSAVRPGSGPGHASLENAMRPVPWR
jgi:hypothetical protein